MVKSYLFKDGEHGDRHESSTGEEKPTPPESSTDRVDKTILVLRAFLSNTNSYVVNVDRDKFKDFLRESWQKITFQDFDDHENSFDEDEEDLINDHTDFKVYTLMYNRLQYE